jgi:putative transposase
MENKQYNPQIHHRRSIRLKGYDYSQRGAYFITICVQDRACLFGRVVNGQMELNDAGKMIEKWWQKIPEKFPDIELGEYTVMPNHFHAVVLNRGVGSDPRVRPCVTRITGSDPRVRPCDTGDTGDGIVNLDAGENSTMGAEIDRGAGMDNIGGTDIGRTHGAAPTDDNAGDILGEHVGSPLHRVVQWFKTMTTNEYIRGVKTLDWPRFNGKLWQRNYYEHIIRNETSYLTISNYIINNPAKWDTDKFYVNP